MNQVIYTFGSMLYDYEMISSLIGITSSLNTLSTFMHNINYDNCNKELIKKIYKKDIYNGIQIYTKLIDEIKDKINNKQSKKEIKTLEIIITENYINNNIIQKEHKDSKTSIQECIYMIETSLYNIQKDIKEIENKTKYNKTIYIAKTFRTYVIDQHLENIIIEYDILCERFNMLKTCIQFTILLA